MRLYDERSALSKIKDELNECKTQEDLAKVKLHIRQNLNLLDGNNLREAIKLYNIKGGRESFKEELAMLNKKYLYLVENYSFNDKKSAIKFAKDNHKARVIEKLCFDPDGDNIDECDSRVIWESDDYDDEDEVVDNNFGDEIYDEYMDDDVDDEDENIYGEHEGYWYDGEGRCYLIFDSYEDAYNYLEEDAVEEEFTNYEIVEDDFRSWVNQEGYAGLVLIAYEDEPYNEYEDYNEIDHYVVAYRTGDTNETLKESTPYYPNEVDNLNKEQFISTLVNHWNFDEDLATKIANQLDDKQIYVCTQDFQGGDFGVGRKQNELDWVITALEWGDVDDLFEDYDDELFLKVFKDGALIDWICDMWEIEIKPIEELNDEDKEVLKYYDESLKEKLSEEDKKKLYPIYDLLDENEIKFWVDGFTFGFDTNEDRNYASNLMEKKLGLDCDFNSPFELTVIFEDDEKEDTDESLKESEDSDIKKYKVTLKHDKGKVNIKTTASSKEQAIKQVLDIEKAPESAVVKCEVVESLKESTDTDDKVYEYEEDEELDEKLVDYLCKKLDVNDVMGWLYDHEWMYNSFCGDVGVDPEDEWECSQDDIRDIIDFIYGEGTQAWLDFLAYFDIIDINTNEFLDNSFNESLKENWVKSYWGYDYYEDEEKKDTYHIEKRENGKLVFRKDIKATSVNEVKKYIDDLRKKQSPSKKKEESLKENDEYGYDDLTDKDKRDMIIGMLRDGALDDPEYVKSLNDKQFNDLVDHYVVDYFKKEESFKNKQVKKESLPTSDKKTRQLKESPASYYEHLSFSLDDLKVHSVKEVQFIDNKCTAKVNITGFAYDLLAESYEYGDYIAKGSSIPIKITELTFSLEDDYGERDDELWEELKNADDDYDRCVLIKNYLMDNIYEVEEREIEDASFDGEGVELDEDNAFNTYRWYTGYLLFKDKIINEAISKVCQGGNYPCEYVVYDENDDVLESFEDEDDAIEYARKNGGYEVYEQCWREELVEDGDTSSFYWEYAEPAEGDGLIWEREEDEDVEESLKEAIENKDDVFWHLRDGNNQDIIKGMEYKNVYLDGNTIRPLEDSELANKFAATGEHADEGIYFSKDQLEKLKKDYNGEKIVFFYAPGDEYGGEYSIILSNEEEAKKMANDYNQKAYAKYDKDGKYIEVKVKKTKTQNPRRGENK